MGQEGLKNSDKQGTGPKHDAQREFDDTRVKKIDMQEGNN